MNRFFDGLSLVLILGLVGFAVWSWFRLPGRNPVHFGLIHLATLKAAMGEPSQGILVLVLAALTSPILLVVFFLRLQPALNRGKELARRAASGVSGREGQV